MFASSEIIRVTIFPQIVRYKNLPGVISILRRALSFLLASLLCSFHDMAGKVKRKEKLLLSLKLS
jgi:hypothetical protein